MNIFIYGLLAILTVPACLAKEPANSLSELTLREGQTEQLNTLVSEHLLLDNVNFELLENLGFQPLIGADLNSWSIHNDKPEVEFVLEDGVVSGEGEKLRGNSFLYTKKKYDDFILYFEFKFDHLEGNSGLMYRSHFKGEDLLGLQYEMDPSDRQWTGLLYAEKIEWLYPIRRGEAGLNPISLKEHSEIGHKSFNPTGWNAGFLRVKGHTIESWLNGQIRTNYSGENEAIMDDGYIALQVHQGKACAASWRNMYILPL